jgi:hypothetical protein
MHQAESANPKNTRNFYRFFDESGYTLRIGRLLLVPKIRFHRMLAMTGSVTATPTVTIDASAKLPTAEVKGENA